MEHVLIATAMPTVSCGCVNVTGKLLKLFVPQLALLSGGKISDR